MRRLLARAAETLKKSSSLAAARLLRAFDRAGHESPSDRRRRRLLFGARRRRAVDRAWGLHDLILEAFRTNRGASALRRMDFHPPSHELK